MYRAIKKIPITAILLILTLTILPFASSYAVKPELKGKTLMFIADGNHKFRMYMSGPESAKAGVLLIHGWWGLNRDMKLAADRYASLGYRAAAIDLYKGKAATDPKQAKQLMKSVKQEYANNLYKAALQALRTPDKKRKLAVIGWSFGGAQAVEAALAKPEWVSATIMYYPYGMRRYDSETLTRLGGPILGNLAKNDYSFTPLKARAFNAVMLQAEKEFRMNFFDARHGFDTPTGKYFNKKASAQAWQAGRKFLQENLK